MHYGLHHHAKKRREQQQTVSAKHTFLQTVFDRLAYSAGILIAVMTAPQIWKIYSTQNATGVSAITWSMFALGSLFWIGYGIVNKEKPIIFTNIVAASLNIVVTIGALLYS
ncbi:MAG: SemiSWEET family transporter [Candidatus Komeilibacteria bacterium]